MHRGKSKILINAPAVSIEGLRAARSLTFCLELALGDELGSPPPFFDRLIHFSYCLKKSPELARYGRPGLKKINRTWARAASEFWEQMILEVPSRIWKNITPILFATSGIAKMNLAGVGSKLCAKIVPAAQLQLRNKENPSRISRLQLQLRGKKLLATTTTTRKRLWSRLENRVSHESATAHRTGAQGLALLANLIVELTTRRCKAESMRSLVRPEQRHFHVFETIERDILPFFPMGKKADLVYQLVCS